MVNSLIILSKKEKVWEPTPVVRNKSRLSGKIWQRNTDFNNIMDENNLKESLSSKKDRLLFLELESFISNGNFIKINQLCNKEVYCIFISNKYNCKLLTTNCKTPKDSLLMGYDKFNHSSMPMLITKNIEKVDTSTTSKAGH